MKKVFIHIYELGALRARRQDTIQKSFLHAVKGLALTDREKVLSGLIQSEKRSANMKRTEAIVFCGC
jgi:hypothetical protein